jgi:hypothetical protein
MSSEHENYKRTLIDKLTTSFNNSLVSLRNKLVIEINRINRINISRNVKLIKIHNLKNLYNRYVANLVLEYTNKKNSILALTEVSTTKNALLIGINYTGTSNELFGCINDTINIKNILQEKFNYHKFNILTDDIIPSPTKINIINGLTSLLVNSNKGDSLFFLYSGHGTCTVDLNNDETDGQDEMIVPLDGNCISDDELNKIIKTNLKTGVKLFMLFDSCFSGTVVDLKYNYFTGIQDEIDVTINPNVSETHGQVIMISGCKDDQTSADAFVNYNGKNTYAGAMTFSFLKTIQELGINITLKTLFQNMRIILQQNEYSQIPQLSSGTPIDINNIYIDF